MQGGKDQAEAAKKAAEDAATRQQDELAKRETAQRLREEGAALQKAGKLRDAVGKYRESLAYVPDPAMEAYIAQVEAAAVKQEQAAQQAQLDAQKNAAAQAEAAKQAAAAGAQKERDAQARLATGQRLRKEGIALQQQGKYREAAAKYRESLPYIPDPELEKIIGQLEAEAARREQAAEQARRAEDARRADEARRAEDARRAEEKRRAEERPAPPPAKTGCDIAGRYEGRNADGTFWMTLRPSGTDLVGIMETDDAENDKIEMRGSINGKSFRMEASFEDVRLTATGTVADDCRSVRVSITAFGDTVEYTLVRKEP
jgi:tetratricopeptide (TPR) repeat protein